jgi:FkbM family methyltransferase
VAAANRRLELQVPDDAGIRHVIREVFQRQCYRHPEGVRLPKAVLDIGANVGLAAAYFRLIYPEALIHCVEPDPGALEFLRRNAAGIGMCRVHEVGLFEGDCDRTFYAASRSVISSVARNPLAEAKAINLRLRDAGRFVASLGVARFDLVKIDTEGSEVPILTSLADVLTGTSIIHVEFHSREDRRRIDDLLNPTHGLCGGTVESVHRGQFLYVINELIPYKIAEAPLSAWE